MNQAFEPNGNNAMGNDALGNNAMGNNALGDNAPQKALSAAFVFLNKKPIGSPKQRLAVNIRSYPKYTCAISQVIRLSDAERLSEHLIKRSFKPVSSSLYCKESYYLCLTLRTKDAVKILPAICEHSERVFLGKSYEASVKEHTYPLIKENALEKLAL